MNSGIVRTRFAPSPTGYMHVGNLRTALYAYLLAKKNAGFFLLRIEDTDQERYVEGATDIIFGTLKETGLIWDEGPDIGGPVGPYVQSQRMHLYKEYAEKLVELGHAYYCFCDKERLQEMKEIQAASGQVPRYDGHCRNLSEEEVSEKLKACDSWVIRQKVPQQGVTSFHDEVFGEISVENSILDDQVLIKSDGMPTYNFANVIDDHLMGITHVIRGNEYLSSTPKYNLLYEAFGWDIPIYIHCPLIMKNQTEKLSKRNGDASYQDLIEKGYLKEAVLNYIALLGWSPGGEKEIFSLEEMKELFEVSGISKSPAVFDIQKLNYLNGEYIRALSEEEFCKLAERFIRLAVKRSDVDIKLIAQVLQKRTEVLNEIPEQLDFIDVLPDYDTELFVHKKMKTDRESSLQMLREIAPVLQSLSDWTAESIHEALFALIERLGVKNGTVLWPLRVAASGKAFTPGGGVEISHILGKEETLKRIDTAIHKLS